MVTKSVDSEAIPAKNTNTSITSGVKDEEECAAQLQQFSARIYKNWDACGGLYLKIGKDLQKAKKLLPRPGEWLNWVKSSVPFSARKAQRLMRVAAWFGDAPLGSYLDFSKAYALTRLPKENLNDFFKKQGAGNDDKTPLSVIQNMSKRDLEKAVRDYLLKPATSNNICKAEKPSTNLPVTPATDGVLDTLCKLETTIAELLEDAMDQEMENVVKETVFSELRKLCEETIKKLPEEEIYSE